MDWIEQFLDYTRDVSTPELFRLWTAITTVSGMLERRVHTTIVRNPVFPNLYVVLVAPPGIGKNESINEANALWRAIKLPKGSPDNLHLAPDSVTKASLIDALERAGRRVLLSPTEMVEYHSLLIACPELGVLLPEHDRSFLATLTDFYDCRPHYRETRRTNNKDVSISNPQFTILSGVTPAFLHETIPEVAWGQGFTSRLLMIYASSGPKVSLWPNHDDVQHRGKWKALVQGLQALAAAYGPISWSEQAQEALRRWYAQGLAPVPEHSKLANYVSRRLLHFTKLCMVSTISRQGSTIEVQDFDRAQDWLLQAEALMPDVFRDMEQKSDRYIMSEVWQFMFAKWSKTKKPLHESLLFDFLRVRVPSEKVERIVQIMEKSNYIMRQAGTALYMPSPRNDHATSPE